MQINDVQPEPIGVYRDLSDSAQMTRENTPGCAKRGSAGGVCEAADLYASGRSAGFWVVGCGVGATQAPLNWLKKDGGWG